MFRTAPVANNPKLQTIQLFINKIMGTTYVMVKSFSNYSPAVRIREILYTQNG